MGKQKENGPRELVRFGALPPYDKATPARAQAAVEAACADALEEAQRLAAASGAPTWSSLMAPLESVLERLDREYSLVAHLSAVRASAKWDLANRASLAALSAASTQIGQNAGLYERVAKLKRSSAKLGAGRRRILAESAAEFELAGVGLDARKRRRFAINAQRLAELGTVFDENVRKATQGWSLTVTKPETLAEMPEDLRAGFAKGNRWRFDLLDPSYVAFMTHSSDRAARKRMALARNARASDLAGGRHSNLPVLKEILAKRWEQAKLLGFSDPASMILSRRMARRPGTVARFLSRLAKQARSSAKREIGQLSEFAGEGLGIKRLEAWDMAFVTERFRQRATGLSDAEVRPYFPASKVMKGLFACVKELFGVSCRPAGDVPRWHKEVQCMQVLKDGRPLGTLYLDLYARPHKQGGAWAHDAMSRIRSARRSQQPVALMNCNFSSPAAGAEARLGWREVVVLFHEAGHAFHHLLAEVNDYSASGMHGVEWDAIELPSQFLESFSWRRSICTSMSSHISTGKRLPASMHAKLERARTHLMGLHVARQISFSIYDLELHRQRRVDPLALWERVRGANSLAPPLPNDRFPCAFGHIFAGGYASGYYGYLWAEVLAADAYEMFDSPRANLKRLGRRYVSSVLKPGGTRDAMENFRRLRGRRPDPQALLRRLGLLR